MARSKKTEVAPEGRPLQWGDMSPRARQGVEGQMRSLGQQFPEHIAEQAEAARYRADGMDSSTVAGKKAAVGAQTLADIAPHVRRTTVSTEAAANRRVETYNRGVQAAHERGDSAPAGAGWYFNHHADIARDAHTHGFDADRATVASAVMSPQNSPENEKAAVGALMHGLSSGSVHVSHDVARHLEKSGVPVDPAHVGQRVPFSQLHPHAMAVLSDASFRSKVDSDVNLKNVSRGGTKENVRSAIDVLTGATHPDEAINPHSAPKVASYAKNIREAVPNTPEHVEYMTRVAHHYAVQRGEIHHNQEMLDVTGLAHSRQGMLDPGRTTAEDTWMNAISIGQPNKAVGARGRTSVMKASGSLQTTYPAVSKGRGKETLHPDPRIGSSALHHAFNNQATVKAAAKASKGTGVELPSVAMQEVAWTQARRETGKDPAFNQKAVADKKSESVERQVPKGQQRLW